MAALWLTVHYNGNAYDIEVVIKPPEVKRTVGRPPRNRRRQVGEERKGKRSVTVRCSKCGEAGHNKLSCMGGLTASQKKAAGVKNQKKRGREEGISTQGDADLVTAKKKKCKKAKTTTK